MFKAKIIQSDGLETWTERQSEQELNQWIESISLTNAWGKPAGWYPITELTEEELATEIERREVESFSTTSVEVRIPAQYQIEITDITAEIEAQKQMQKALEAQSLGNQIICKVWAINDSKNLSVVEMQALFADSQLSAIERCLRNGALQTAKALIEALDSSYFSAEEKQIILGMF